MTQTDYNAAVTTDMTNAVPEYLVDAQSTDGPGEQKETEWMNVNWPQYLGYYKTIPEFKTAINGFATWVIGKGWIADGATTAILDGINGWGEDTFLSILWNMIVTKKVGGDAYAEIIRNPNTGTLINLKSLDPGTIKHVVNRKGFIIRYEQTSKTKTPPIKFRPQQILHLCNDRIADEIHGTSITEAVEWVILARNEALDDQKTVMHRNVVPLRIIEVDSDNTIKITKLKADYENAIKKKEVMIIPKGNVEIKDSTAILQDILPWIKYLENFFYQALGVPKVILGGSEEFTEASSKIGYLTFEQIYTREVSELIADLWNQLAVRITINKPASIKNELLQSEEKNTGQVGFQPKEATATLERE